MADVTIKYKGATIASMDTSGTKTVKTSGKYCEGDIQVVYSDPEQPTQSKTVTPTASGFTVYPDNGKVLSSVVISGDADLIASNVRSGKNIFGVDGTLVESSDKVGQACDAMQMVASTSYTATNVKLTVAKSGTYTVRWFGYRNSTSGTNGSQLYIDGKAYGSTQTSFGVNSNGQRVKLTGVTLTAGQEIVVRARSRSTSYYMWVMGLSIIEE